MMFPRLFGGREKSLSPVVVTPEKVEQPPTIESVKHQLEDFVDSMINNGEPGIQTKAFDWAHYNLISENGINGMYSGEFATLPNLRTLKSLYGRENWVGIGVDAISRQFLTSRFILKRQLDDDKVEIIKRHPAIDLLNSNDVKINAALIIDLLMTGQAYIWTRPDSTGIIQVPADRVEPKLGIRPDGKYGVIEYEFMKEFTTSGGKSSIKIPASEITHIKMPNPFSNQFGMPPLLTAAMPILIDRYGKEYVISFFLRGGTTAGICETTASSPDQITRLLKTIQTAFSTRRNMHSDKILPNGVTWKTRGLSFSEIMFDVLQEKNAQQILARLGVPPVVGGMTDSVNYANAEAQLEQFHRQTIIPMSVLFCTGIQQGSFGAQFQIQEPGLLLGIDFSDNRYVNEFGKKLDEDAKLAPIATVNERRERLGLPALADERGGLLSSELTKPVQTAPTFFGLPNMALPDQVPTIEATVTQTVEDGKAVPLTGRAALKAAIDSHERAIPKSVNDLFMREFGAWEQITLDNITDEDIAIAAVEKRAGAFGKAYSDAVIDYAMRAYDLQMAQALKKGVKRQKAPGDPGQGTQTDQDREANLQALRDRSKRFLSVEIAKKAKGRFVGYSKNEMIRVYDDIEKNAEAGQGLDEIASNVRVKFGEFYEGQATTIMRTEYGSAMADSQRQYSEDLATQVTTMRKVWMSIIDDHTRDSHVAADGLEIEGDPDEVMEKSFSSVDSNAPDLRYPKDEQGAPEEVINCRCVISYEPVEWKD